MVSDLSNVPDVDAEKIVECTTDISDTLASVGVVVLDGSRAACGWTDRMAASDLPVVERRDYVANSNNTHEVPNVAVRLEGYSPILGVEGAALGLRPSLGLRMIEDRASGSDGLGDPGFTIDLADAVFHLERNLGGELLAASIAEDCLTDPVGSYGGVDVDLTEACTILAAWDGSVSVDAVGAALFTGVWAALGRDAASVFAEPASIDDPLGTPLGYTDHAEIRAAVRAALARTVQALADAGMGPDVTWGEAHAVLVDGEKVGQPGSTSAEGAFDVLQSADDYGTFAGWEGTLAGREPGSWFGASYEHVVAFDPEGVQARGAVIYGQATMSDSPWSTDQLPGNRDGAWFEFPFTEEQISADPELVTLDL
jgi:acyl-homoserine-lactone acylase